MPTRYYNDVRRLSRFALAMEDRSVRRCTGSATSWRLCETLNFARAAETCNVSQPALTRAVRKLEEELGGLLLRREHLLTHLTDFGRLVRPHLEQMTFSIGPSQWSTTRQFGTVVTALVRDLAQRC